MSELEDETPVVIIDLGRVSLDMGEVDMGLDPTRKVVPDAVSPQ